MANTLLETGRNALLAGTANWANGKGGAGAIQAALLTYTTFTTGMKQVSGATVATPCVLTVTAHGYAVGDIVLVSGVGGTLTANGIFQVIAQATNTITLGDYVTGANVVGVGTYTSGGIAINLGPSLGGIWSNFSANLVGTPVALTGNTEANGIAGASATTFTSVTGAVVSAVALIATASAASGTVVASDLVLGWIDGQMIVTCAATAVTTTLPVERLPAVIPLSTVLSFDDGTSATLSAANSTLFGRTLTTTTTTTVTPGARATAPASGSGLPVTPNGGNISITWDTVGSQHVGVFKL
jgi:hypothetical protein